MSITTNYKSSKFIIYSDSRSVLSALQNKDTSTPLISKLLNKINTLSKNNRIILTWIPNHIGIHGNERLPFQKLLYQGVGEGATPSPGLLHFTLDLYLIMLSVKQGGIKYHFLSVWYDSTCDWTPVSGPLVNTWTIMPMGQFSSKIL